MWLRTQPHITKSVNSPSPSKPCARDRGGALYVLAVMDLTGMAPSSWGGRASSNERQGILAWTTAPSAAEANAASSTSTDNAPERLAREHSLLTGTELSRSIADGGWMAFFFS